ncbi:MAG: phosphodiester glycosidase family protein [Eubacteriales bacterium]|nr:phosphodiester glycosidase family protein [Eubacteriales bacterium]
MPVERQRHTKRNYVILKYFAVICVAIGIFTLSYFMFFRDSGEPKPSIVSVETPDVEVEQTPHSDMPTQDASTNNPQNTIIPSVPGDFSAVFPNEDTGAGALHSYQSDTLRIAINKVQENEITYYVADIWIKSIDTFRTAFAYDQYGQGIHENPVTMAANNSAILAVTGDYYSARAEGIVIRNGKVYRDTLWDDVAVLFDDGTMETYTEDEFSINNAIERHAYQAWSYGPELLENGQPIEEFTTKAANPRCAIGYYEPGHYCLVVVDGRQPGYSVGMTLAELSAVFYDLGCKTAYNLDGGQTAMMIFEGSPVNQAYHGGRQCSDIIYFAEK